MKVAAISPKYSYSVAANNFDCKTKYCNKHNSIELSNIYYPANISFGIANSAKLKKLFSYGLPCMYSGVKMIDPTKVQRLLNRKAFDKTAVEAIETLSGFQKSITGVEYKVYNIIKNEASKYPELNLQELLRKIMPEYKEKLRQLQAPVFHAIELTGESLPEDLKPEFKQFMSDTIDKLNDRPVFIPFSSYEFKYKLSKLRDDIAKNNHQKANKVMDKMSAVAETLNAETTPETTEHQKIIICFLETILKSSVLKKDEQLKKLINDSKKRLNGEKIPAPFSRKTFIYDLQKFAQNIDNTETSQKFLQLAQKLPTSSTNTSAYILKFAEEPSWKIGYRLVWPNFASVEHILPQFCGGEDKMSNFGGAGARENALRGNIDFTEQIKRRPMTPANCQKYVNRLIDLAYQGVFEHNKINIKYIEDFKETIKEQSKGEIVLDISRLEEYKKGEKISLNP